MQLVTLIENTSGEHKGLYTEHGLSFYLETDNIHLLLDFGESGRVLENAHKLNVPLDLIDYAVCSHSHYDHASGFHNIVSNLQVKQFVTGPYFWQPRYAFDGCKYSYLGASFGQTLLQQHQIQHKICNDLLKLADDCWAVGNFPRICPYETIPQRFVSKTDPDTFAPDLFEDEICLAVETGEGLAVIVGCSHPGVVNMLTTVHNRLQRPIVSVWGGAHLVEADSARIKLTADALRNLGVQRVGLCHCSGEQLLQLSQYIPEIECCRLSTGDMVVF